jgi:hypothetical protein
MVCEQCCATEINLNIFYEIYLNNSWHKIAYSTKCQPHQPANFTERLFGKYSSADYSGRAV